MRNISQQLQNLSPEQRALLEAKLKEKGIQLSQSDKPNGMASLRIPSRNEDVDIPLSFAQQRLWFVQQLDPDNNSYNVPCVLRLEGKLDIAALCKALNEIVKRHEILRTVFVANEDKEPIQIIRKFEEFVVEAEDNPPQPTLVGANGIRPIENIINEIVKAPFDLGENLLRIKLLKLDSNIYLLIIATHHIVSDRWSIGVFLREIAILYRAF
ncbi:MAG: condensation domain-containing protein [Cyanobacteria bacterium P01_E01_bin.35]